MIMNSNATNNNCVERLNMYAQCALRLEKLFEEHINNETKPMQFSAKLPRIRKRPEKRKQKKTQSPFACNFPSKFSINLIWYLLAFSVQIV